MLATCMTDESVTPNQVLGTCCASGSGEGAMLSRGRDRALPLRTGDLSLPGPQALPAREPSSWRVPVRYGTRTHARPIDKPSPAPITIKPQFFFSSLFAPRSAALHHIRIRKSKKKWWPASSRRNPNTLFVALRRSVVRLPSFFFYRVRHVDIWPLQPLDYGTASRWPRMRSSKASLVCFLRPLRCPARCPPLARDR